MTKKLRPATDSESYHCLYSGGYRGDRWVAFRSRWSEKKGRGVDSFAAGCRYCKQFWGWSGDVVRMLAVAKAMKGKGCPRCEKRLSSRAYAKLQKRLRKRLDR